MVLAVALMVFLWWRSGLPLALWRGSSLPALLPVLVLAFGTTLVSPLQYPWYDAMLLPLLAAAPLAPYAGLDRLLVARGMLLAVMTLPGVRVNGYQHLWVRWANLIWLAVFLYVVGRGSRPTAPADVPGTPVESRSGEPAI